MHRIEGEYNSRVTGINLFLDGPPGTKVTASWLNMIQEEICYVIEQAGVALETQDTDVGHNQLYQALAKIGIGGVPLGTEMLMHQDVAPIGWTIRTDINDQAVMITRGRLAGGWKGGDPYPWGSWVAPDHALTEGEIPAHSHDIVAQYNYVTWGPKELASHGTDPHVISFFPETITPETFTTFVGGNVSHNHGGSSWRPASQTLILCRKEEFYQ